MEELRRTAQAEADLIDIWRHIAQDNTRAADKLLNAIDEAFRQLADHPRMGPLRTDLAPHMRYFVVGKYLILYRATRNGVLIVRVVHGARYLPDLI